MVPPVAYARALYTYNAGNADELSFEEEDTLTILDRNDPEWWKAERNGVIYLVPGAYLEPVEG